MNRLLRPFLLSVFLCFLTFLFTCWSVPAGAADLFLSGAGGEFRIPTKTMVDKRFQGMIRQKYDFSCGSAALASLLTYHYNHPVDEKSVLEAMYAIGDKEKIRKEGFSLLDMKRYLESVGYKADGFRDSLDKLASVGIPAVALINDRGYMHFVLIKGVSKNEVLIGDPALGGRIVERAAFEKTWNSILFVILSHMGDGRKNFNAEKTWHIREKARFSTPLLLNELGSFTVQISPTPNYY